MTPLTLRPCPPAVAQVVLAAGGPKVWVLGPEWDHREGQAEAGPAGGALGQSSLSFNYLFAVRATPPKCWSVLESSWQRSRREIVRP